MTILNSNTVVNPAGVTGELPEVCSSCGETDYTDAPISGSLRCNRYCNNCNRMIGWFNRKENSVAAQVSTQHVEEPIGPVIKDVSVHSIQTEGTQSRAAMDEDSVAEYAARMEAGDKFPAAVVFYDGERYWLGDGFHRLAAAKQAGFNYLTCEVRKGTWRDALRYSFAANQTHGVRRTNTDKRYAVELVLADAEWRELSNHIIADMCGVSHPFVAKVREEFHGAQVVTITTSVAQPYLATPGSNALHLKPSKRIGKDGKEYPATKPKPAQDAANPDADISFNPVELDAEISDEAESLAKDRAEAEKKVKPGAEIMVPIPLIKTAEAAFGALVRAINAVSRHPYCKIKGFNLGADAELNAILERIFSANGPVEMVDGGWRLKDADEDGLAARTIAQLTHSPAQPAISAALGENGDAAA